MAVIHTVMATTPTRIPIYIHMERIRRMTPTGGRGITGMATAMAAMGAVGVTSRYEPDEFPSCRRASPERRMVVHSDIGVAPAAV